MCCPQPTSVYQFHQTQYLAPGVGKPVRSHLILMYQRVGRWNGRTLEVLLALKRGSSDPSTCLSWILRMKGLLPRRKAMQERCQPQQRTLMTSLWRHLEPRGPQRSDEEKAWWQVHPQGREHGVARGVSLLTPVTPRSWWGSRLVLAWRLYSCG